MNSGLKIEDDYLQILLKFKNTKANQIKRDLFKNVEPGILEIDINTPIIKEKIEKTQRGSIKKKQEQPKPKKQEKSSIGTENLFNKGNRFYVPLDKTDESVFTSDRVPTYNFKPNRETMHMMIKKAAMVKSIHELFCEEYDGYKKLSKEKIEEENSVESGQN